MMVPILRNGPKVRMPEVTLAAQKPGSTPENHPELTTYKCTTSGGCVAQKTSLVIDWNAHRLEQADGSACPVGSTSAVCSDDASCNNNCVVQGVDYAKAGVRTPLAGVITAIVVLLAIYALPALFYWIPSAPLAAVIIHAVGDLVTSPKTVYEFWKISPVDVFIFFAGVGVAIGVGIEEGIYTGTALSLVVMLIRNVAAKGTFLRRGKSLTTEGLRDVDIADDEGAPRSTAQPSDFPIYLPLDKRNRRLQHTRCQHLRFFTLQQ